MVSLSVHLNMYVCEGTVYSVYTTVKKWAYVHKLSTIGSLYCITMGNKTAQSQFYIEGVRGRKTLHLEQSVYIGKKRQIKVD